MGADVIVEQTRSIAKNPLFKPSLTGGIDYIQLESGWQESPGNLSINQDRFPEGMTSVVEQIHASGFKAGICIDPFSIELNSKLIQKHPEVCLRAINREKTPSEDGKAQTGVLMTL